MFDRLKAFITHILDFWQADEDRDNYPYGIEINGFEYFADAYIILADHEWHEYGVRWGTQAHGTYEHHGGPFTVRFNPKFQMHNKPPEVVRDYDQPIYS
jgi:hypothetical protein